MKLMRRLTDKKSTPRLILQSLPIIPAAIAFVLYIASLLPWRTEKMARSVALVEKVSYYRICADGRTAVCFRNLGDSCVPEGMSVQASPETASKSYITGCWINRLPLPASCRGLLLTPNADCDDAGRVAMSGMSLQAMMRKKAGDVAAELERLEHKAEEAGYYMRIHNVNDDGYNIMAAYTAALEKNIWNGRELLKALRSAAAASRLTMVRVTAYTLTAADTAGNVSRRACLAVTPDGNREFRLLQTADRRMPADAAALYPHRWLTPAPAAGDSVFAASIPGTSLYGFKPAGARAGVYKGAADGKAGHDLPPMLVADGSPVFTADGRLAGFSIAGRIVKPGVFGFSLKNLY